MPMQVGQSGKNLFKEWEGLVTHEYLDSGGAPTIGIGHLLTRSERTSGKIVIRGQAIDYRNEITEQQCWDLLDQDIVQLVRSRDPNITRQARGPQPSPWPPIASTNGREAQTGSMHQ
jgi:lysozyme